MIFQVATLNNQMVSHVGIDPQLPLWKVMIPTEKLLTGTGMSTHKAI